MNVERTSPDEVDTMIPRSTPFALRSGAARHPEIASRGRRDNAAKFSSIARNSPQVSP